MTKWASKCQGSEVPHAGPVTGEIIRDMADMAQLVTVTGADRDIIGSTILKIEGAGQDMEPVRIEGRIIINGRAIIGPDTSSISPHLILPDNLIHVIM